MMYVKLLNIKKNMVVKQFCTQEEMIEPDFK